MSSFHYAGSELETFALAKNWKGYLRSQIAGHLGSEVLEVGAGLGTTTRFLCDGTPKRWLCLEPDQDLALALQSSLGEGRLPACCEGKVGTLTDLGAAEQFDTILYIDVLEHIEDDHGELQAAAGHLRPGGKLIVLSPAHQWLFTPFDQAIGHFRRYSKKSLAAAAPPSLRCVRLDYLDAVGLLASLGNRLLLHSSTPTPRQIQFWDRRLVTVSRKIDRWLGHTIGKSVLGIWQKLPAR
ncbi:MAG: class I SAM-dependent methyltransferase [Planctomycetes bacterium]|nr:class I SAM-dependent methyltransferase [Planctomycetota bacterium]